MSVRNYFWWFENLFSFLLWMKYRYEVCRDILQMILKKNSHFFDNFLRLIVKIKVAVFMCFILTELWGIKDYKSKIKSRVLYFEVLCSIGLNESWQLCVKVSDPKRNCYFKELVILSNFSYYITRIFFMFRSRPFFSSYWSENGKISRISTLIFLISDFKYL